MGAHDPKGPETRAQEPKIAVVFKTVDVVDECRAQRVFRLAELTRATSMHVWVLYDGNASRLFASLGAEFPNVFTHKVARAIDG